MTPNECTKKMIKLIGELFGIVTNILTKWDELFGILYDTKGIVPFILDVSLGDVLKRKLNSESVWGEQEVADSPQVLDWQPMNEE